MKVILLENVKGLGKKGDLVKAKAGHARNFLLPRGLAKEATEGSVKQLKQQKKANKIRKEEETIKAKKLAEKISELSVEIKSKSGDGGRLFGSVTSKNIATALQKQHKIKVDKRKIFMNDNIKNLGVTIVNIKVDTDITADLKVHVVEE